MSPPRERPDRVAAVILAAGTSSRWGEGCKLLEPYRGRPLVAASVRAALASDLAPVVVVAGREADEIRSALRPWRVRVVVNPDPDRGMVTSLARGIRALDTGRVAGAAVLLGDEPEVSVSAIRRVVRAWRTGDAPIARALYRDRPGHPVVFGTSLFSQVTRSGGGRGVDLLAGRGDRVLEVALSREGPRDVDTREDYEALSSRRS